VPYSTKTKEIKTMKMMIVMKKKEMNGKLEVKAATRNLKIRKKQREVG
jgi:hypothetical protein